jgi:hypothetical protein
MLSWLGTALANKPCVASHDWLAEMCRLERRSLVLFVCLLDAVITLNQRWVGWVGLIPCVSNSINGLQSMGFTHHNCLLSLLLVNCHFTLRHVCQVFEFVLPAQGQYKVPPSGRL